MSGPLHPIVETPAYLRDADMVGISEAVRARIVDLVSKAPTIGDEISGSGGVRKFRFAGRGEGKEWRLSHHFGLSG